MPAHGPSLVAPDLGQCSGMSPTANCSLEDEFDPVLCLVTTRTVNADDSSSQSKTVAPRCVRASASSAATLSLFVG